MSNTRTIRPGLLLGLKTRVAGGVRYFRKNLPATAEGPDVTRWETTRIIDDVDELDAAQKVRSAARREIEKVASRTSFGLVCANRNEKELDGAEQRARDLVEAFMRTRAKTTRIDFYLLRGRIADDDEQAARAIASDIRDLIESMGEGIEKLDVVQIRRAANEAREMLGILSEDKQKLAGAAIEAARAAARQIVARVEKKGEDSVTVLSQLDLGSIQTARVAFLDVDDVAPAEPAAALPAVQLQRVAEVEDLY